MGNSLFSKANKNVDTKEIATMVTTDVTTALSTTLTSLKDELATVISNEVKKETVALELKMTEQHKATLTKMERELQKATLERNTLKIELQKAHQERDFLKRELHVLEDEMAGMKTQIANADKSTHEGFATVTKYNKAIWKHVKAGAGTGTAPKVVTVKKRTSRKGDPRCNSNGICTAVYKQNKDGLYWLEGVYASMQCATRHLPYSYSTVKDMVKGHTEIIGYHVHKASHEELQKAKKLGIYHEW